MTGRNSFRYGASAAGRPIGSFDVVPTIDKPSPPPSPKGEGCRVLAALELSAFGTGLGGGGTGFGWTSGFTSGCGGGGDSTTGGRGAGTGASGLQRSTLFTCGVVFCCQLTPNMSRARNNKCIRDAKAPEIIFSRWVVYVFAFGMAGKAPRHWLRGLTIKPSFLT